MNEAIVVTAGFYSEIAAGLSASCRQVLSDAGLSVRELQTDGSLEIPQALQYLAKKHAPVCMVALGCVIRGETYHFEIVANTTAAGIMQVQLQTGIPVGNGVLTVENREQAMARLGKGGEAAAAAVGLAHLMQRFS